MFYPYFLANQTHKKFRARTLAITYHNLLELRAMFWVKVLESNWLTCHRVNNHIMVVSHGLHEPDQTPIPIQPIQKADLI